MKILLVHPAIRIYRAALFRMLGDEGIDFLFTMVNDPAAHSGKETERLLRSFPYRWTQANEIKGLPMGNVSLDLWRVFQYDVVIFSGLTSIPFLLCAPLLKLLGKRVILFDETWRYQYNSPRYRLMFPYVSHLVRRCSDAAITSGTMTKSMFSDEFGVEEERLFVAYNTTIDLRCVELDPIKQAAIRTDIEVFAHGRKVLLFLARLVPIKALDVLLHALTKVENDCCLIVVGKGPSGEEWQTLASRLGIAHRVSFLGECSSDEAPYYYRAADVFVLPSRFMPKDQVIAEGWGFTLNEAMSLETPVITTTAVGAAPDLIKDGETGMLAIENDPDSLAEKIDYLMADDERRIRIGRQGREWLLERCSYEENLKVWMSAVSRALASKDTRRPIEEEA